jgi:hypothetical protein
MRLVDGIHFEVGTEEAVISGSAGVRRHGHERMVRRGVVAARAQSQVPRQECDDGD